LQILTVPGRMTELPRYLVVDWRSGRSEALHNERQALERMARLSENGVPALLIDLEQIESKLSTAYARTKRESRPRSGVSGTVCIPALL
jgi:hypothetical protein